ncbi:MAG: DUF4037 domain-containing protein [Candidatus Marinimicrobia bacterium]|nr:DUF4037 domain-containing protein [Candidatus Neomarinimicrobiota bacterium]
MNIGNSVHFTLANKIAQQFKTITCVETIALGGSQTSGWLDKHSDIDLYIYSSDTIPIGTRQTIIELLGASKVNLNLTFWDVGDEWYDLETGIEVDIIYWNQKWIEDQLDRILVSHQACLGYSTCFWQTVLNSKILFDRQGWFSLLKEKSNQPYPEQLKRAIISKNHPVLRSVIPSYYAQIKKGVERRDLISINHCLAALFASYFDVLFAVNKVRNPGEKKVLRLVSKQCSKVPMNIQQQVECILQLAAIGDNVLLHQLDEFFGWFRSLIDCRWD